VFTPGKWRLIARTAVLKSESSHNRLVPSTGLPILICSEVQVAAAENTISTAAVYRARFEKGFVRWLWHTPGTAGYWEALRASFAEGGRAALVGVPLGSFAEGYTNSVAGLSAAAASAPGGFYRYDKHHLVPFGEFIPFGFRWFVDMMRMPLGDFNRGPLNAPSFVVKGERVGPNVCYEDLFGEELAARFADPARAPTIFANVSNIAWFGDSVAIDQHLQISRLRTLELQRPMLRATNTGATAVIDHRGVVTHALAPHTRGVLEATVQGREGLTPYARWASAFGLWPLGLAALAVVAAFGLRRP